MTRTTAPRQPRPDAVAGAAARDNVTPGDTAAQPSMQRACNAPRWLLSSSSDPRALAALVRIDP